MEGAEYTLFRRFRLTERTIVRRGQRLLTPEWEIEGRESSLHLPSAEVIELYADHGTHEQFHSEFKTDLDLERLPSGKFDTNVLVLSARQPRPGLRGGPRWVSSGWHSERRTRSCN